MIHHMQRRVLLLEEQLRPMLSVLICLLVNVFCVNPVSTHCMLVHNLEICPIIKDHCH